MDWLLLAVLGIILAAFLLPHRFPEKTVEGFEREMDILSHLHRPGAGRWVLMPRRDERFLGPRARARARAVERRRRVLVVLLESIGITALIGAFPPLRAMWVLTAVFLALLVAYLWLLVQLRAQPSGVVASAIAAAAQDGHPGIGHAPAEPWDRELEPAPVDAGGLDVDLDLADAGVRVLAR